jgi:hypothetical protein
MAAALPMVDEGLISYKGTLFPSPMIGHRLSESSLWRRVASRKVVVKL